MASTYNLKQRLTLAIVPRLASLIIRCLGATLRYEDVCEPGATPGYDSPPPAVYAFWHRCLLTGAWRFRKYSLTILISRSFDGELIARTVERLGYIAIRGSSSRDGAPGLRNMQRAYLDGHYCAFTADGPRGPAMVAKPGAAQLAQLVNTTVRTCYIHPHRAWQLRSWDRFLIPKPFSRVTIAWTRPATADLPSVQAALDRSVKLAESVEK
ncbi:MAG: lysophospholipid acyltransferase family protein [Edaphobacter sp.]